MITDQDDLKMMLNDSKWPMWPLLPLKHRTRRGEHNFPDCGFLIAVGEKEDEKERWTVYLALSYEFPKDLSKVKKELFASAEDVNKEWMVD